MKLHLLHGPAISQSRLKLSELKKNFTLENTVTFEDPTSGQIMETVPAVPLIANKRLYIFENPAEDLDLENVRADDDLTVVFWFDHQLDEKKATFQFVKTSHGQIVFFPESKEITAFPFIDALGYKNKRAYLELQKLKEVGYEIQYIVTMIFYLLRSLTVDNQKAPSFVQKKTAKQRQNFSDLPGLYRFVLETDYKIKKGLLEPDQAEFLLVNQFLTD